MCHAEIVKDHTCVAHELAHFLRDAFNTLSKKRPVDQTVIQFFANPAQPVHRQHLALRRFYYDQMSAEEVSKEFGLTKKGDRQDLMEYSGYAGLI